MKGARYGALFFQASGESAGPGWMGGGVAAGPGPERVHPVRDPRDGFSREPRGRGGGLDLAVGLLAGRRLPARTTDPARRRRRRSMRSCGRGRPMHSSPSADGFSEGFVGQTRDHLETIPTVLIGPGATEPSRISAPTVALAIIDRGLRRGGDGHPVGRRRPPATAGQGRHECRATEELVRQIADGLKASEEGASVMVRPPDSGRTCRRPGQPGRAAGRRRLGRGRQGRRAARRPR